MHYVDQGVTVQGQITYTGVSKPDRKYLETKTRSVGQSTVKTRSNVCGNIQQSFTEVVFSSAMAFLQRN